MAVDSNVLIYERMREEFQAGKPLKAGIDGGYDKAFWTIIDSHVTTLITAVVLFLFGTGPIKGFAVTLSLGVILNLFTALFGTRVVYDWLLIKRWIKDLSFFQLLQKPNFDFIGWRHYAFAISGILCLLGIIGFVQLSRGHGNLGVEFSGGTLVQMSAAQPFTVDQVRDALDKEGWGHAEIQPGGRRQGAHHQAEEVRRVRGPDLHPPGRGPEPIPAPATILRSSANPRSAPPSARICATRPSSPSSSPWWASSSISPGASNSSSASAPSVATFHDVLAVLGVFWLLNREITLLVVTALLTLAGYSLTDTVVVFDRIRENLARRRGKLADIINLSVNEVLSRTIITSSTVFLVVVALFLFGGVVLRDFALAMIMGVLVGTYSSVFVASPVVYAWRKEASGWW